jgi:hypothetical protein
MGTLGVVGKTDAEEEMARFPWDINKYEFRIDSHGAGRWRGSPGIIWEGTNEGGRCNFIGVPGRIFHSEATRRRINALKQAYLVRDNKK